MTGRPSRAAGEGCQLKHVRRCAGATAARQQRRTAFDGWGLADDAFQPTLFLQPQGEAGTARWVVGPAAWLTDCGRCQRHHVEAASSEQDPTCTCTTMNGYGEPKTECSPNTLYGAEYFMYSGSGPQSQAPTSPAYGAWQGSPFTY